MSDVVPVYLYCPAFSVKCFSRCLIQAGMPAGRPATQHTSHRRPGPNVSGTCGRPIAAYQHAARHLLLSLTRQWLITERHLTRLMINRD